MEQHKEEIFVFVVCGSREHIDTLHFSLKALKKFSKKRIIIVTDSSRNELAVEHSEIIDVRTPTEYNHHQASIYLKTGLHKFLPKGNLYCYLDTDVVALSTEVDTVFEQYQSPIAFCTDHCKMDAFSPIAMYCDCTIEHITGKEKLRVLIEDCEKKFEIEKKHYNEIMNEINQNVIDIKKSKNYFLYKLQYALPNRFYYLNSKYKLEKKTGKWFKTNGREISLSYISHIHTIENKLNYRFDTNDDEWKNEKGASLVHLRCNHLHQKIKEKFNIDIHQSDWQHWNGGVFLFDDKSHTFLDSWHTKTKAIFQDITWKNRDQGTLIATVWEFQLQNHITLKREYNFLADYNHRTMQYIGNMEFTFTDSDEIFKPVFIHIYHHWGDLQWHVWNDVTKYISE